VTSGSTTSPPAGATRSSARGASAAGAAAWLVVVGLAQGAALVATYVVFVRTRRGQLVDAAALDGNSIGRSHVIDLVDTVLGVVSVASLAGVTLVIAFIALARRRVWLAVGAVSLIAVANVVTQLLKTALLTRPELAPGTVSATQNTLPSGHTTVAMSVAVALTLVVPSRLRGATAVLGAAYGALTGVATLSAGWHRPSDAVAACLVVGSCAAVVGLALLAVRGPGRPAVPHAFATALLLLAAVAALAGGALAFYLTAKSLADPAALATLGRRRRFLAYAGGAATITGTAAAVMAVVLVTVHRVVGSGPASD
jgi:hypothetical protein